MRAGDVQYKKDDIVAIRGEKGEWRVDAEMIQKARYGCKQYVIESEGGATFPKVRHVTAWEIRLIRRPQRHDDD